MRNQTSARRIDFPLLWNQNRLVYFRKLENNGHFLWRALKLT